MSNDIGRREFLSRVWKWATGLVAIAGAWTTWDVLRPKETVGFGGVVRTVAESEVPSDGVLEVKAARAYLTKVGDELIALAEKCPHLACRVNWCDQAGDFECPCHGSFFNRAGEHRTGPAPRGMDRYPVQIVDGVVEVDTGELIEGAPPGEETLDEPVKGPPCTGGGHG